MTCTEGSPFKTEALGGPVALWVFSAHLYALLIPLSLIHAVDEHS